MRTAAVLLVSWALAGAAAGQGQSCTVDDAGTDGYCIPIKACLHLHELAEVAKPYDNRVKELRNLVGKCAPTTHGLAKICCNTDYTCRNPFRSRVIDGENADIGEFPWLVSLQYTSNDTSAPRHGCGGTLITSRHVLTAAHCVTSLWKLGVGTKLHGIVAGETNFDSDPDCSAIEPRYCAEPPVRVKIENITVHPKFQYEIDAGLPFDIAVLKLASEVEFSRFVRPVCLLRNLSLLGRGRFDNSSGLSGTVAGWGRSVKQLGAHSFTPHLQKAKVLMKDAKECPKAVLRKKGHICAGNKTDTCSGDSGGPLMLTTAGGLISYQAGIVSLGTTLCGSVSAYTRVLDFIDWIYEQTDK